MGDRTSRQTDEPKGMLLGGGARRRDVLGVCSSEITIGVNMRGEMVIYQEVMLYNRREETTGRRERETERQTLCSCVPFWQRQPSNLLPTGSCSQLLASHYLTCLDLV